MINVLRQTWRKWCPAYQLLVCEAVQQVLGSASGICSSNSMLMDVFLLCQFTGDLESQTVLEHLIHPDYISQILCVCAVFLNSKVDTLFNV